MTLLLAGFPVQSPRTSTMPRRPVSVRALQAFVLVAELESFRAASERLYMDSSTISKLVRRLEVDLGVELLARSTRMVTLTAAGVAALDAARTLLLATCRLYDAVGGVRGESGTVATGPGPPVGASALLLRDVDPGLGHAAQLLSVH